MAQTESYQGLARKWRPQTFEDLAGQETVARSLQSALKQSRVAHGHMLAGPRGVGKTTSARILAKALNCAEGPTPTPCGKCRHCIDIAAGTDLDVIEIDAASNTGVDNIRELRERVVQAPFAARYKVYIIDEVHMLSTGAFNALLKTLEEPPPNVVFVFATTELEKVPETIRSRCVIHAFRRLGVEDIVQRLTQVVKGEKAKLPKKEAGEILSLIARSVEGGMRDALVALDQLLAITDGKPDIDSTIKLLGLADQNTLVRTVGWLADGNAAALLELIDDLVSRGRSLERFVKSMIAYLRDLMLIQAGADEGLVGLTGDSLAEARKQAEALRAVTLYNILNQLFELEERLKQSTQARFLTEFTFLRVATVKPVVPIDEMIRRVQALPEASLGGRAAGAPAAPSATPPKPEARREATVESIAPAPTQPTPAAAVMRDSAADDSGDDEPASAPATESPTQAGTLAGLSDDALLDRLVPHLPDAFRFLVRYLKQAVTLTCGDVALQIQWGEDKAFGRKMVERPENIQAIEEACRRAGGRPIRVVSARASEGAAAPGGESKPCGTAALGCDSKNSPVMRDSAPRTPGEVMGEGVMASNDLEDDEDESWAPAVEEPLAPPPKRAKSQPVAPKDPRGAVEKARALLSGGEETARRVKMLTDMFNGRPIDETGKPISV